MKSPLSPEFNSASPDPDQLAAHSCVQSDALLIAYVCFSYFTGAYHLMISSATFRPSMAADVIPPAYPAPSPHG